jgi:hypothetical protein
MQILVEEAVQVGLPLLKKHSNNLIKRSTDPGGRAA